jgi:peroxiredoxin
MLQSLQGSKWGWGILIVSFLGLGALGGAGVSKLLAKHRETSQLAEREELKKQILAGMKTLQEGDILPDYEFDDLDGSSHRLSNCVKPDGAIIGIVSPDCMVCAEEINGLSKLIPDSTIRSRIIFISSGDVRELENLRRISSLTNLFLCDRKAGWSSQFKIYTYPFNMVVGPDLAIRKVIPSALLESDIIEFQKEAVLGR